VSKAVLITGANSGIGIYTTKKFVKEGYHVFAGYKRREALKEFEGIENITSILIDVTDQKTVDDALSVIINSDHKLLGLVNNAGIFEDYPLLHTKVEDLKKTFEVNYFGVHRMVEQFGEVIIKNKGRIVNIGSISGILSSFADGGYNSSKHALEGYTDTLAKELKKFDVHVCIIEPGNYKTNIGSESRSKIIERVEKSEKQFYVQEFEAYKQLNENDEIIFPEPNSVANAIYHAITSENPKSRYLVTDNQLETDLVMNRVMTEMLQLNQQHKFNYSKERLISLLEELYSKDLNSLQFEN